MKKRFVHIVVGQHKGRKKSEGKLYGKFLDGGMSEVAESLLGWSGGGSVASHTYRFEAQEGPFDHLV